MRTVGNDIRYAFRQLWKSPGFTAVAVLVLALGIGANTAIFSAINGVLLRSLPVREPQSLRVIGWTGEGVKIGGLTSDSWARTSFGKGFRMAFPYPTYREFAEKAQGFSHVFGFSYVESGVTVSGEGFAAASHGLMVSGNFFDGYGARVLIGRAIRPEDDRTGAAPVAVITYPFWRRHYDLDPQVLGRTLMVNSIAFTVVGVLPEWFRGPLTGDPSEFYVPLTAQPQIVSEEELLARPHDGWVRIMGRLAPAANEGQARTSLEVLFRQSLNIPAAGNERPFIVLADGKQGLAISNLASMIVLTFLQALVGVVLLIACANVASLLLARGAMRHHEMSVRAALGAGRWRLIRQSLVESLVLSLGAAALGLVLSVWIKVAIRGSVTVLLRQMQRDLDYMGNPSAQIRLDQGIDGKVLLFALGIGFIATMLAGLIPALRAAHVDPSAGLKDSVGGGAPRLRWGRTMIVVQTALSLLLVTGAGLLTRTILKLRQVDPGYDVENLLLFQINPLEPAHQTRDLVGFFDQVRATLAAIPGVRSVSLSHVEGGWYSDISIPGRPIEGPRVPEAAVCIVSDGWLATKGIALLAGRDFAPTDMAGSPRVALINEAFARKFYPEEYPLGRSLKTEFGECEIVGLCGNHRLHLQDEPSPILYVCARQEGHRRTTFTVRSVLPPLSLVPAVRKAVAKVDPGLPLEGVTTQKLRLRESVALERTLALLCISLALLALGLSCIGLYGLMAYNVTRRTAEIGVRMALGARPADVARPILREAGLLAIIGVALGFPMALALAFVLSAVIYGIAPYDPVTMVGSGLVLLGVAVAAAWVPARRAARIDPMVALRYE